MDEGLLINNIGTSNKLDPSNIFRNLVNKRYTMPVVESTERMPVEQRAYGFLSPKVTEILGYNQIETGGLGSCIGLILTDPTNQLYVLAHVDTIGESILHEIISNHEIFSEVGGNSYEEAIIIYSDLYYKGTLETVKTFAKEHAKEIREIHQPTNCATIGIDINGKIYQPTDSLKNLVPDRIDPRFLDRHSFKYMNEYIKGQQMTERTKAYDCEGLPEELLEGYIQPNTLRRVHHILPNGYGHYTIRIDVPSTDKFNATMQNVELPPGINLNLIDNYVEVNCEGYRVENDKTVVMEVNRVANELFEKLKNKNTLLTPPTVDSSSLRSSPLDEIG